MEKIATNAAPAANGPYSQAIRLDRLVFCSGQIPLDPATGEMVAGDIEAQTRRVLDNQRAVLEVAGSSLSRVVKTTVFLADLKDYATVNRIYGEYFSDPAPARSAVQVAALPRRAAVEIEAVAEVG